MNRVDLERALDRHSVNPQRYDLDGGVPIRSEGLVLVREGGSWLVRHFERGTWSTLKSCASESDACDSFLEYAADPFYRT